MPSSLTSSLATWRLYLGNAEGKRHPPTTIVDLRIKIIKFVRGMQQSLFVLQMPHTGINGREKKLTNNKVQYHHILGQIIREIRKAKPET